MNTNTYYFISTIFNIKFETQFEYVFKNPTRNTDTVLSGRSKDYAQLENC